MVNRNVVVYLLSLLLLGVSSTAPVSAAQCLTASPGAAQWQNQAFNAAQTGVFIAEADVTVSSAGSDVLLALSQGPRTFWTGLAAIVRFHDNNTIDARNGGVYSADRVISYQPNTRYRVRMEVDVRAHSYSVFIDGIPLAKNYAFRTEQQGVTQLDNWVLEAEIGSGQACDFILSDKDWKPAQTISSGAGSRPQVAMSDNGSAIAVWEQPDGVTTFGHNVWVNFYRPGSGWGTASALGVGGSPQAAMDSAGNAVVIWVQGIPSESPVVVSRFVPGVGWDTPRTLERFNGFNPRVVMNAKGNAVAVWMNDSGPIIMRSSRYVVGQGWTTAENIGLDTSGTSLQVATDNSDKATAVWVKKLGDIEAARLE